jgi:D-3-phosphoglycerate dehydrogenase
VRILHVEPDRYDDGARAVVEAVGEVAYVDCADQAAFGAALAEHRPHAVFVRLGLAVDRAAFQAAPDLRWIVTPTTGLDHIDVDEARRRNVEVVSLKGHTEFLASITTTAEHTWALLLAVRRRLVAATEDVLRGNWRRAPFLAEELDGETLGVVGCGRIGRMVAGYGIAFGMRVLVHDRDERALTAAPVGATPVALEELLAAGAVVSLHLPLDPSTAGFLSRARIDAMRPGAVLLNTARGELVDEAALLDALRRGHLGGAGLDVLSGDPVWDDGVPPDHPLVAYARTDPRLVVTPHTGGYGRTGIARTRRYVAECFAGAVSSASTSAGNTR